MLKVMQVNDFAITGDGTDIAWEKCEYHTLSITNNGNSTYKTLMKISWSESGVYFLFYCQDNIITCTKKDELDDNCKEDFISILFQFDKDSDIFFKYYITPIEMELPLLIQANNHSFFKWKPLDYIAERKVRKKTKGIDGKCKPLEIVNGWHAEFQIPFKLISGFHNVPPAKGTTWRSYAPVKN